MYPRKDLYGNQDLQPAARAMQHMTEARQVLMQLPEPYHSFYTDACLEKFVDAPQQDDK